MTFFVIHFPADSAAQSETYQFDIIGDSHWSKWNYTDLVFPYRGVDTWIELRNTYWLGKVGRTFGLYGGLLFANMFYEDQTKAPIFDWQKHLQFGAGLQYYPFYSEPESWEKQLPNGGYRPSFGLRFFLWAGWRSYYQEIENSLRDKMSWDTQLGADYFYESISRSRPFALTAWSNASFRMTNFSHEQYNVWLWTGNVRGGPKWQTGIVGDFFFNVSIDWTIVSHCQCRWWENYMRLAGGIAWYPFIKRGGGGWSYLKRLNIYVDYYAFNLWLGEDPNEQAGRAFDVSNKDLRFGISFATPNLFKKDQ